MGEVWAASKTSIPNQLPKVKVKKIPKDACTNKVNNTKGFSEEDKRFTFQWRSRPSFSSTSGRKLPSASFLYLSGMESVRVTSLGIFFCCWKRIFGWVISGVGKPGMVVSISSRPCGVFSITPKSKALPTQADTQAGFKPTSRRSTHILHFSTRPLTGSNCGALYGHTQVQYPQPKQISGS